MVTFVRLIESDHYRYTVRVDSISNINTLLGGRKSFTAIYLLEVEAAGELYTLDLGRLMLSEASLLPAADIHELISRITPSMLYSYQSNLTFNHIIRSFNHKDLPGEVVVSPYNSINHEETSSSYDPSFQDMVIRCAGYDLSKVFPIIDSKLRNATWYDSNIILKSEARLVRTTEHIHFISFAETEVCTKTVVEMAQLDWVVDNDKVPLVVINGALYTNEDVFVYRFNRNSRKLIINPAFLESHYVEAGYESSADMLNDSTTFIILVEGVCVMMRDVPVVPMNDSRPTPCIYFDQAPSNLVDYICVHQSKRNILDISIMNDKHINILNMTERDEHHVYVDAIDDGGIRLVQMVIC